MVKWLFFRQIIFRTIAVLLLVFIVAGSAICPNIDEQLDFTAAFYVAAHMVKDGKSADIYPEQNQKSFSEAPFDVYAHKLLPALGPDAKPFFQYPPLVAFLLEPFSLLPPRSALLAWQMLSLLALLLSAKVLSQLNIGNYLAYFWNSLLYLPIAHTLFIGQIGLVILCLPLAIGYYYFMKGHPSKAGLIWSLFILKPQFIIIPAFFATVLASLKKWHCLAGLILGVISVFAISVVCPGPPTFFKWLCSLGLNADILNDPACRHKLSLVSSFHEVVTGLFPNKAQPMASLFIYLLSAGILLHALFTCREWIKNVECKTTIFAPVLFAISLMILPLTVPYLRYYDLCIFALIGMVFFEHPSYKSNQALRRKLLLLFLLIDLYLPGFMYIANLATPLVLVIILLGGYLCLITALPELPAKKVTHNN